MFLLIDTSERDHIRLVLFSQNKHSEKRVEAKNRDILIVLEGFLSELGLSKEDVQGVAAVVGEGSFTSTRLAVTVANTFAYAAQVPVLAISAKHAATGSWPALATEISAQPVGQYISAEYSGEPNIGKS